MRVTYINPFVRSVADILKELTGHDVKQETLTLVKGDVHMNGLCVLLGLTGSVEGQLTLNLDPKTAKGILAAMGIEDAEITDSRIDDMSKSALMELGNMVGGKVVSALEEEGFDFDITPPILLLGSATTSSLLQEERIILPVKIEGIGKIEINIIAREKKG